MSSSPYGFLVAPPAPLLLYLAPGQGTVLHWCLCRSLVMLSATPSRVAHPAPATAIPREALPASSMGQAALPIMASSHNGGGWREGRDLCQDVAQPKTSTCRLLIWRNSVRASIKKGLQSTSVCTYTCVSTRISERLLQRLIQWDELLHSLSCTGWPGSAHQKSL